MLHFNPGAGTVVAADTKSAMSAVDEALLSSVRMYASVLEATSGSGLPAAQSQKLLTSLTSGLQAVVQGRGEMVSAIRQMTEIKGRSNLTEINFGCPEGWGSKLTGKLVDERQASPSQIG